MLVVFIFMGLSLSGCNDYPGRQDVKMTHTTSWGDSNEQEIILGGFCHIDSINDVSGEITSPHIVSRDRSVLKVVGWATVSGKDGLTASDIAIALKPNAPSGARLFAAASKGKRPDVADYFKNLASVDSGFKVTIDLSDVPPGTYILEVIQHKDGKNIKCQATADIIIKKWSIL